MNTKAIRLREYLAKIEQQHYWDDGQMRDPQRGLFAERPDVTKDEERAFAMGHLSEFREAAYEKREALIDADIASVARLSLGAAAAYRRDVHHHDALFIMRAYEEADAQRDRILRRWSA